MPLSPFLTRALGAIRWGHRRPYLEKTGDPEPSFQMVMDVGQDPRGLKTPKPSRASRSPRHVQGTEVPLGLGPCLVLPQSVACPARAYTASAQTRGGVDPLGSSGRSRSQGLK